MPLHETAKMAQARPGVIRSTQEYVEASPAASPISTVSGDDDSPSTSNSRESPRELRNKAEKQRRDKLNQSISELASMVPPVVAASRKIDKTGVLRLTAHFLRSHQYVFGESITPAPMSFSGGCSQAVMSILDGFLLTTTYKGIIVVVSPNVQQYLGYTELDLLGQNVFTIIHKDDQKALREQLMPRSQTMGPNGELIIPDRPDGKAVVAKALADEKRRFVVRFKKHTQRSESAQYLSCHVEGSLRKSDRACRTSSRCCQMLRRARARGDNPCSSGNDVVFVGVVRPKVETFRKEALMEEFRMEYRTRHSIDGQIIQCDQRISLITGYMTDEVHGVNAMNFMHRDDVRWVIIALRQMYDQHRLYGESCYRLMMKNGQFIYMRTRGALEVDKGSAVTSFVCNNTVIDAVEGEQLIKQMKAAYNMLINNNINPLPEPQVTEVKPDDHSLLIEDPKELEQVILHLVTNLPSPLPAFNDPSMPKIREGVTHLNIIPPGKEHILSGIEKIYTLVNYMDIPRSKNNSQRNKSEEMPQTSQPAVCFEPVPSTSKQGSTFTPNISLDKNYRISPDVEDFGEIYLNIDPTEQCSSNTTNDNGEAQASTSFADYIAHQPNTQAKYNFSKQDSDCEIIDLDAPSTSSGITGTKRSIDQPDEPEPENSKKKMVVEDDLDLDEDLYDPTSPILEEFIQEAILTTQISQIDDAIICLEEVFDPFSEIMGNSNGRNVQRGGAYDPNKQNEHREPN